MDLTHKDQDMDKDLTPKDQYKDKDLTPKDQDKDKNLKNAKDDIPTTIDGLLKAAWKPVRPVVKY